MVPPVVLLQVTGKQTVLYGELEKRDKRKIEKNQFHFTSIMIIYFI